MLLNCRGVFCRNYSIQWQISFVLATVDYSGVHFLLFFTECVGETQNQCPGDHERVPRHVRR